MFTLLEAGQARKCSSSCWHVQKAAPCVCWEPLERKYNSLEITLEVSTPSCFFVLEKWGGTRGKVSHIGTQNLDYLGITGDAWRNCNVSFTELFESFSCSSNFLSCPFSWDQKQSKQESPLQWNLVYPFPYPSQDINTLILKIISCVGGSSLHLHHKWGKGRWCHGIILHSLGMEARWMQIDQDGE